MGYFTINPFINDGFYDTGFLDELPAVAEDEYLRHIRFPESLRVEIDGKTNRCVIYKPLIISGKPDKNQ